MKILMESVDEKQGKKEKEEVPALNVNVDGYIPNDYVNTDLEKLELYQRLDKVQNFTELQAIKEELNDLYGKLPKSVNTLVEKREFDLIMNENSFDKMKEEKNLVEVYLSREFSDKLDGEKLFMMLTPYRKKISITYTNKQIVIKFLKDQEWLERAIKILKEVETLA